MYTWIYAFFLFSGVQSIPEPANAPDLDFSHQDIVRRAEALSFEDQLLTYLGRAQRVRGLSHRDARALTDHKRLERLRKDPAIRDIFPHLASPWLIQTADRTVPLYRTVEEYIQLKIMIARNLHFRGLPATASHIDGEYRRILQHRKQFAPLRLFTDRNALYMASTYITGSGEQAFGREHLRSLLQRHQPNLEFFRADDPQSRAVELRRHIEDQILHSGPLTLIFEGLGRKSKLRFGKGISIKKMADLLAARHQRYGPAATPPILIVTACYGHDFVRNLLDRLHAIQPQIPKPVVVVPEEYGQFFIKKLHDHDFFEKAIGLKGTIDPRLGDLFGAGRLSMSVYVPDGNNIPLQVL